jgi:hypothetical protein
MALTNIIAKIMVELLSTQTVATAEAKRGPLSEFVLADVVPHSTLRRGILP